MSKIKMQKIYYCDDKFESIIAVLNKRGWIRDANTVTDNNAADTIHKNAVLLWTNLVSALPRV